MNTRRNRLLDIALLFAPSEFRTSYREEIYADVVGQGVSLRTIIDVLFAGVAMRLEAFLRDVVFAIRTLSKSPANTFVAIAAIALAIGLNVAVASVVEGVLLRQMPYPQADRLAFISSSRTFTTEFSYPKLEEIRTHSRLFENVAGSTGVRSALESAGARVTLYGLNVTGAYFATLGVKPQLGRMLGDKDEGEHTAIISDRTWRTFYDNSPAVLGQTLRLADGAYRIVGVLPSSFRVPSDDALDQYDYFLTADPHAPANVSRSIASYDAVVRLRPGVTTAQAEADLQRVLTEIDRQHPGDDTQRPQATVTPIAASILGPVRTLLLLLYVAVCGVFLIGCANVASIGLVRAISREPEFALRAALGATRRRIRAQLVTESFVLAIAGGVAGAALGWGILGAFSIVMAKLLPRWDSVGLDARVFWYAGLLVVFTAIVVGIVPSFSMWSVRRRSKTRAHATFVSVQIALAMAVLVAAGLLLRSFTSLTHVELGFDPRNVYSVTVDFQPPQFNNFATEQTALRNVANHVQALPGVERVAAAAHLPFSNDSSMPVSLRPGEKPVLVTLSVVGPDYLQTLHIPLLRGRSIDADDRAQTPSVALVNAAFARQFFGTIDAVGREIYAGSSAIRIAGVAGDTRKQFAQAPSPRVYLPITQVPGFRNYELAVRAQPGHRISAAAIDAAVSSANTEIPQPTVRSFQDIVAGNGAHARAAVMLFTLLAFVGLMLALSGLYAVTAFAVARRTREFGIRKAIGARTRDVLGGVLWDALRNALIGICVGVILIAVFAGSLQSILYQTAPLDPLTFAAAVFVIVVCTLLAALVPAARAVAIQPARALRYE